MSQRRYNLIFSSEICSERRSIIVRVYFPPVGASCSGSASQAIDPAFIATLVAAIRAASTGNDDDLSAKINFAAPPMLDDNKLPFVDWLPRITARMHATKGCSKLIQHPDGTYPAAWDACKVWLTQCVPFSDFDTIDQSTGWHSAIAAIRTAHTSIDTVTGMRLNQSLNNIALQANETPVQMITRARGIAAKLKTVGQPCTEFHIVSCIVDALQKNSIWASVVQPFVSASGTNCTLAELQNQLSATPTPLVAGAMSAQRLDKIESALANLVSTGKQVSGSTQKATRYSPYPRGGYTTRGRVTPARGSYFGRGNQSGETGQGTENPHFGKTCNNCGKKNHIAPDCRSPCTKCGSWEHKATKCPRNRDSSQTSRGRGNAFRGRGKTSYPAKANMAVESTEEEVEDATAFKATLIHKTV